MTTENSLVIKVDSTDTARAAKSLDELATSSAKAEKSTDKLMQSSRAMGGAIGILATAAITAGGALMVMTKNAINSADAMNDMHLKTGLAFKDLAAYDLLARQSGTSLQGVAQGFKFLSSYMVEHSDKLKTIGVDSKNSTAAMGQFADAIAGIQDPALKTKLAMEVLGRSGMDLIPMLSGGSAAFEQARKQTEAYASALEKAAPKADQFNDGIARMEIGAKVIGLTLADKMLPTLLAVSDALLESSVNGGLIETWGTTGAAVLKTFAVAALNVAYIINQIGDSIGGTAAKFVAILSGDFAQVGVINGLMLEKSKAAREEVDRMTASIWNAHSADASAVEGKAKLNKELEDAARKMVVAKQAADAHQKAITNMVAALEKESATYGMTAAQIKIYEAAQLGMTKKELEHAIALIEGTAEREAATKAEDALQKQLESGTEAYNQYWNSVSESTAKINENAAQLEFENAMIGKTAEEISRLTGAREDVAIATLESTLAVMRSNEASDAEVRAIALQVEALYRLKAAREQKPMLVEAAKKVEEETKAHEEMWKKVDGFAHDAFDNIFDKGKNAFEEIGKVIKKSILDMLYKMTVQKWLFNVGIAGGGTMAAGAAQAFGGTSGGGTSGMSLLQTGQTIWNGFSGSMATGLGKAATWAGQQFGSTALMEFGAGATSVGTALAAPTLAATTAATEAAILGYGGTAAAPVAAGGAAGMGATVATAMPYIAAAAAAYMIGKSIFGGNGGTPGTNVGAAYTTYSPTGAATSQADFSGLSPATAQASVTAFTDAMNQSYRTAAQSLGITAASTIFSLSQNLGENSKVPQFFIRGGAATEGMPTFASGWTGQSDAAMQLAASRAVFTALQESDLPAYLSHLFDGLVAGSMTQQDIDNTIAFAGSVKQMREALLETREPLEILRDNVNAGMTALGTSAETFRTGFVAAIDAGINPQVFAQWQQLGTAIDQLAAADAEIAARNAEAAARLAETNFGWQQKINVLTGEQTQRQVELENALNGADATTAELITQFYALEDAALRAAQAVDFMNVATYNNQLALENQAESQRIAAEEAKRIGDEHLGLQDQLNQLTMTEVELRALQRESIDKSNQSLFDSITLEQNAKKIEDERIGLQDQLNQLTMTSTNLLGLQRDALDESNRALFDQINAARNAAELRTMMTDIDYGAVTFGMSSFDKSLFDINKSISESITKATELGATESELTRIRDYGTAQTQAATVAERERLDAIVESSRQSIISAYQAFVDKAQSTAAAVVSAQEAITNGYLSAQDRVASAQKAIADVSVQAAKEMRGFADNISEFLTQMRTTDIGGSSKIDQFSTMLANFTIATAQAKSGDVTALGGITGQAQALLDAKRASATSAVEYARFAGSIANTLSEVATLADGKAGPLAEAVDPMTEALTELNDAQAEFAKWQRAASESGASTQRALVDYASDWRKANSDNSVAQYELMTATYAVRDINLQQLNELQNLNSLLTAYNTAVVAANAVTPAAVTAASVTPASTATSAIATAAATSSAATVAAGMPTAQNRTQSQVDAYQNAEKETALAKARALSYTDMRGLAIEAYAAFHGKGSFDNVNAQLGSAMYWGDAFFGRSGGFNAEELRQRYSFAVGTNELLTDGAIFAHAGEQIKPAAYVDKDKSAREETNALLRRLTKSNDEMKKELTEIKKSNYRIQVVEEKWDVDGLPLERV